ncbi:MAG: hypothetical protein ABSH41_10845 [Syntrophobacteraceae bacterium]|jgi:hypothetical protein
MSHSNFSFLMALDADAFLGGEDERREFISEEFSDRFGSRLDDNNWFHLQAAFFKDGSYLMWPNSEPGIFAEVAIENRWDAVRRYALQCVAVDFRLFGAMTWTLGDSGNAGNEKIDGLTFDDLLAEIYNTVPASLSEQYSSLRGKPAWLGTIPDESWTGEYDRRKMVLMFEALRNSDHVPFTKWCIVSPYEYRAFDLTRCEEPNAILITDIHT